MAARVLAVANQKGGVGKTTTALTLGAALARLCKRTLVMDLDPHANASVHLAHYPEDLEATAYDIFQDRGGEEEGLAGAVKKREDLGFDFVPGGIRLAELENDLKGRPGKGLILSRALGSAREGYDYIVIDCPPHVGILLVNALLAANLVVIPIQTDFLAFYGLRLLFDTMRTLNKVLAEPIAYKALPTMFDPRAGACKRVLKLIKGKLGERTFETVIHMDTKFREACASGRVVYDLDPFCRGARQYTELAREIMRNEDA